jgi:hypothetical protein
MADAHAPTLHEPDVPRTRVLAWGGGAILATVVIAVAVAFFIVHGLTPPRVASTRPVTPASEPPLQATPERDLPAFHREKQQLLHEYAWVDRAHGVVRIPIQRAMALLVERKGTR